MDGHRKIKHLRAMWNEVVAGIVFQHASIESLIRELSRNPALLGACGFDILPRHKKPVAELRRNEETPRLGVGTAFIEQFGNLL